MKSVNMHEAKTNLSKLVDEAANGEPFIIAKAGKPLVKVVPFDGKDQREIRPIGFLEREFREGLFKVPDDFDRMDEEYIVKLFEGDIE